MKTAVIGSRTFNNLDMLTEELSKYEITEIISGGAKGADSLAETYATKNNIPTTIFKADWKKYGRAAGPIRNKDIVENSERIIAFWDYESKGTKNSIDLAIKLNKDVIIVDVRC